MEDPGGGGQFMQYLCSEQKNDIEKGGGHHVLTFAGLSTDKVSVLQFVSVGLLQPAVV